MGMKFSSTLAFRLFIVLLVMGVVLFAPFIYLILSHSRSSLENQVLASAKLANETLIHTTRYDMLMDDRRAISITLKTMMNVPQIERVRIYGQKGIIFSSIESEVGKPFDKRASQCMICHSTEPPRTDLPDELTYRIVKAEDGHRVLIRVDPIFNRRSCGLTGCHPSTSERRVLGVLETDMSLKAPDALAAASRNRLILYSVLILAAIEIVTGILLWRLVHQRVSGLTEATLRVAAGDYDVRIEDSDLDEIGTLSQSFNKMIKTIRSQRNNISDMMRNMADASATLSASCTQLHAISGQQASGATEQVATIHEVASTTEEVAATSEKISENASSVQESASRSCDVCNQGKDYVQKSISDMDKIGTIVDQVSDHILLLTEKAKKIGGIINLIEEIGAQVGLLSLNASIEAMGAGEHGKRFVVVADEVRRLAAQTMKAVETVRANILDVRRSIEMMETLGEDEREIVAQGVESVRELVGYFEDTLQMVESTRRAAVEITVITRQQAASTRQMVSAIKEVEDVAYQAEQGGKSIEALALELSEMAGELHSMAGQSELSTI